MTAAQGLPLISRPERARHEIKAERGSLWVTGTERGANQWQGRAELTLNESFQVLVIFASSC